VKDKCERAFAATNPRLAMSFQVLIPPKGLFNIDSKRIVQAFSDANFPQVFTAVFASPQSQTKKEENSRAQT
jgi:hypothetical protein